MSLSRNIYNPRGSYTPENIKQRILEYETIKELSEKDNGLYQAARSHGILDEACSHMKDGGYQLHPWTKEELFEVAAKHSTLKSFRENEPKAYAALRIKTGGRNKTPNKWYKYFEEATAHMTRAKREWTDEEILAEAAKIQNNCDIPDGFRSVMHNRGPEFYKKAVAHMSAKQRNWTAEEAKQAILEGGYKTRQEIFDKDQGLYDAARRRGVLEEACSHMKDGGLRQNKWTKEELFRRAAKYSTIADFCENDYLAYKALHDPTWGGYLKEATSHLTSAKRDPWTKEELMELASRFPHRSEFKWAHVGAYAAVFRLGIEDEVFAHMEPANNLLERVVYAFEWLELNTAYIGLTWDMDERIKRHFDDEDSAVRKFVEKGNEKFEVKVLTDFILGKEAALKEKHTIQEYKDDGWKLLNKTKGGELGGGTPKHLR